MKHTGLEHIIALAVFGLLLVITGSVDYALIAMGVALTVASFVLKRGGIPIAIYFAATIIIVAILKR